MNRVPIIAGIGLVTPLGNSAPATWDALLAGRAVADHARVSLEPATNIARVSALGLRAAREAVAHLNPNAVREAALVIGTSKGTVESWLAPSRPPSFPSDTSFGLAHVASELGAALFQTGPRLTLSSACASGLHALIRGAMLIRSGEARRVLVVATEAAVHPLFVGSFRRLGVLAPEGFGCRPLDRNRAGFLMSEAAAAVWLVGADQSDQGVIRLDRFALASDATHLTGNSPEMAALRHVVHSAAGPDPIDLFHAHATGTVANDAGELRVIDEHAARNPSRPCVYSHKGALGHSQGAAGLVSVVINVMCHLAGLVPPNVRTTDPLPTRNVELSTSPLGRTIRTSLALAAGFGGPVAAVRLVSSG